MTALEPILVLLLSFPGGAGQHATDAPTATPTNCEITILRIETAMAAAQPNGTLEIVAHRGTLDSRDDIIQRRLFNVVTFVTDFYDRTRLPKRRVVAVEGRVVEGHGTIRLFVRGRLVGTIVARPDRDIQVGHCDDRDLTDRKFYPWRENAP